jgi:uncharacterized membrane protein YuzA (DUF378 family)
MAAFLAWGLLGFILATVLAYLMWLDRGKSLWARLEPAMAVIVGLLGLWALARYGDALVNRIWP